MSVVSSNVKSRQAMAKVAGVAASAWAGAKIGFVVTGFNPVGGVIGGVIGGGGAALVYEFGGYSSYVKGQVKDALLWFNGKQKK